MNGFTVEEHDGEKYIAVRDVDGLHNAIGHHLVQHPEGAVTARDPVSPERDGTNPGRPRRKDWHDQPVRGQVAKGEPRNAGRRDKSLRGIFLAFTLGADELEILREFLKSVELDENDEVENRPAQFCLDDVWTEKELVAA